MKRVLYSLAVVLILAGFGFTGFSYFGKNHKSGFNFKTVVVEKKDMKKTILATGSVKPMVGAEVKVGARVSGKVERLFVKVGDKVIKNQLIAIVEHEDLKAKVDQSRANLNAEKARLTGIERKTPKEIKKLEAEVDAAIYKIRLAEANFKRDESLLKKGVVSSERFDTSLNELEVLKAELRAKKENLIYTETKFESDLNLARANVAKAKAGHKEIEIDFSYATIKSPIAGIIASISTQEGETIAAELNSPTFVNIIDMDKLQINAFVDETDIGYVKIDQETEFTVDTYPGEIFKGVVNDIYPKAVIQENVVNYEVIIRIPNSVMSRLRPEMTTSVTVVIGKRKGVLAVPKGAVKRKGNNSFVLVKNHELDTPMKKSPPIKKDVKIGWRDEGFIEIREGLQLGDVVVIADRSSSGSDHAHSFGKK